jgi:hypothetical protein
MKHPVSIIAPPCGFPLTARPTISSAHRLVGVDAVMAAKQLAFIHYLNTVLRILGGEISCGCTQAFITHDY